MPEPHGLTPSGQMVAGNPVLSWERVRGATSYDVQVATNPDFVSPKYTVTTTNNKATPRAQLPAGEVWWRVQANSSTGDSGWSIGSYQRDELSGPGLRTPQDGEELDQPERPALLSWEPVEGAVSYTIEIDDSDDFIGATNYSTRTTSYVVPKPQVATNYYWHVRAVLGDGVVTRYSETRTYLISGLEAPRLVSPSLDTAVEQVEDVVLDWTPVDGAATYDLQISTDNNFNTFDDTRTGIRGTRYSPPVTLRNDQYYWRVRPVDTHGNQKAWSDVSTWSFQRHWPDQPHLEFPVDEAVVGDPFFYQWTPVDKADRYMIQMSPTGDFQDTRVTESCVTVQTTFTPGDLKHPDSDDCYPAGMGTYSWRVIAYDSPKPEPLVKTDAISAEVETFSYKPETTLPVNMLPRDGATVDVPTLNWDGVPGAAWYLVTITPTDGGSAVVTNAKTHSTSYTPQKLLAAGKTYRWSVQPVSGTNRPGPVLVPQAQPTFTVAAMAAPSETSPSLVTPSNGATSHRLPTFTWTPVQGAAYYKLGFRKKGAIAAFTELTAKYPYPAGEDTEDRAFDSYEWEVSAYRADGTRINSSSPSRWFALIPLPKVDHARAAMSGQATLQDSTSCAAVLPDCANMRQTPILAWDPVPGAGVYKLYVSRDKEMTHLLPNYPRYVDNTTWTSYQALFDSQAGEAYYWSVSPCVTVTVCNAPIHAPYAFDKRSNPVELISPVDVKVHADARVQDDVTFRWRDFLETNLDPANVDGTGQQARVEARQYRVEVSKVPTFQTLVDKIDVDQTTYTAFSKAYPEGPLYWRVSAIDGSGNVLTSSPTWQFWKASDAPTPTSPVGGHAVAQTQPFEWTPMAFASSYDIEVYRDGDKVVPVERVISDDSMQAAFTARSPLPVSNTPYTWRVRRVDASGNPGPWTGFSKFKMIGTKPDTTSPHDSATLVGNDALFTWGTVAGATSYRFERRAAGSASMAEVVSTYNTAWAPSRTIADGKWQWRVSTVDAVGKVMASSDWQSFLVDGTSPTVTSRTPVTTALRGANFVVKFSEPVKGVSTTTFRLFQNGVPDPVPAAVTLNATGTKAVLNPVAGLKLRKTYIAKVTTGVTDLAGNRLPATKWKVVVR